MFVETELRNNAIIRRTTLQIVGGGGGDASDHTRSTAGFDKDASA